MISTAVDSTEKKEGKDVITTKEGSDIEAVDKSYIEIVNFVASENEGKKK